MDNPFVNFRKRGVELPNGFKDLAEVLQATDSGSAVQTAFASTESTLADLDYHLRIFRHSTAKSRALWIDPDATSSIVLFSTQHSLRALVMVDLAREQMVRTTFELSSLSPFEDDVVLDNHRALQFVLPSLEVIDDLIRRLLTVGFGITNDTVLRFRLREKSSN